MPLNEAQTRKEIIDKRLKVSGWDIVNPAQVTQELDIRVGLPQGIRVIKRFLCISVADQCLSICVWAIDIIKNVKARVKI